MQESTIVAVYRTPDIAAAAVKELEASHVPAASISRHSNTGSYRGETRTEPEQEKGFWASIFGTDDHADRDRYQREVQGGKTVVTVRTPDAQHDHISAILERHDPVDIDTEGHDAATRPVVGEGVAPRPAAGAVAGDDRDRTMKLSEEHLNVGKRAVTDGTTRVRRYVTETPVEKTIGLHDEKVTLDRRPVKEGEVVKNPDFSEKSFAMTESHEEAVVAKDARVVEELRLHKEGSDRDHTVKDTVRKHEVEIDGGKGTKPVAGAPADRKI